MPVKSLLNASLEVFKHQHDGSFFEELTEEIESIRDQVFEWKDSEKLARVLSKSRLSKIIEKNTNLRINLGAIASYYPNAMAFLPLMDAYHPLQPSEVDSNEVDAAIFSKQLREAYGQLEVHVDFDKGWVEGEVTRKDYQIFFHTSTFTLKDRHDEWMFSSAEIAGVLLHEVGHLMTWFAYLGRTKYINHVLDETSRRLAQAQTQDQRVKVVATALDALELDEDEAEQMAKCEDETAAICLIASEIGSKPLSVSNAPLYDRHTIEAMAEQFAVRMGAGKEIATYNDKQARMMGEIVDVDKTVFHYRLLEMTAMVAILPVLPILFSIGPAADTHERYVENMERNRREIIAALKDPSLHEKHRERYQEQIDTIDKLLENAKTFRPLLVIIEETILPSIRRGKVRASHMRELERLVHNELYVSYNRLQNLQAQ